MRASCFSLFYRGMCGGLLVLATACTPVTMLPDLSIPLRNPTAQVASQVDVTADRLAGHWRVVEAAGVPVGSELVVSDGVMRLGEASLPFVSTGPGRFQLGEEEIWVHWLDINNRTAAMGEPGGARMWIMDRTGKPGERLKAAREILDWYGYDLTRMERAR